MSAYTRIIVDSNALIHNYRYICSRSENRAKVMAMVKSDGYGHSMTHVTRVLSNAGCNCFGVAELGEGVILREAGCRDEIYVFLGFEESDIDYLFTLEMIPVVFTIADLERISAAQMQHRSDLDVYLKFDCGMSRLGFDPSEAAKIFSKCEQLSITPKGIISHFPCSDDRYSGNSREVSDEFFNIGTDSSSWPVLRKSICNSGGLLYYPESHGDMVRVGISLYGYYPDGSKGRKADSGIGLKPALRCVTRIIQVKTVPAGTGISYGHTYVTDRDTRLAVLPVGYRNGYFRSLSNRAEVLINGHRAPIRGRVCMNMCMVDVTGIEGVAVGDEAVLLGSQGAESIDADDIGGWSDTISYEVLCALGNNNTREFV